MAGLSSAGFEKKTFTDIKAELETQFKALFGSTVDLSSTSVLGQLLNRQAKREADIWEVAEAVYASRNKDSAQGILLDRIAAEINIIRLSPSAGTVEPIMRGVPGTVIPANSLITITTLGTTYEAELDTNITLSLSNAARCVVEIVTLQNSTAYTVTINGVPFVYTSDSTATEDEITAGLRAEIIAGAQPVDVVDNSDGTIDIIADDQSVPFSVSVSANLDVPSVGTVGNFTLTVTGAIPIPANTATTIVTPVSGWDSVNNPEPGTAGRDTETDEELRLRMRTPNFGNATDEAIRARLLSEVDGVTFALVYSNREITTVGSRPPKSFETVVLGGDDADVAQKIWETMPSGIEPYGTTTVIVEDSTGRDQTIKFTRPEVVYVWFEIDMTLYSEETFPTNGVEQVKNNIVSFADQEYQVGIDVIRQRLASPIYQVPGIGEITIRVATSATSAGPPGTYTESNVAIGETQIAAAAFARITVNII